MSLYLAAKIQTIGWSVEFTLAGLTGVLLFLVYSQLLGLYGSWRMVGVRQELTHMMMIWLMVFCSLLFLAYALKVSELYSRRVIITWFFLAPVSLSVWRVMVRQTLMSIRATGQNLRTAAVIGQGPLADHICKVLSNSPWLGVRLEGCYTNIDLEDEMASVSLSGLPCGGRVTELVEKAKQNKIDMVFVAVPPDKHVLAEKIVGSFADTTVNVFFIPTLFMTDLLNSRWGYLEDIPYLSLHESPFYGLDGTVKRMEDIILSLFILTLIAIPMLIIAAGIKLTSKGPVIFKQRRYGLNNQEVMVWKFRTMTVMEDGDKVTQAQRHDKRVTRFGSFLRRTSLDELPQFINVLQGHMSIVGPRPHAVAHNEQYRKEIHGYTLRHKVKPGITGWAQVNGWRGETDTFYKMRKRIDHDLWYIHNWSIFLDLKIILMTIFTGFINKRAY